MSNNKKKNSIISEIIFFVLSFALAIWFIKYHGWALIFEWLLK